MNNNALDNFFQGIELFRAIDAEIPSQVMSLFLVASRNEGASITTIADRANQTVTSTSRNLMSLSEWRKHKVPGWGLIIMEINPEYRRERVVHLTNKGKRFLESLINVLG